MEFVGFWFYCFWIIWSFVFLRRTASGGTVARPLTGRAHLQREAARSLSGNYREIYLRMNWCRCVRRWEAVVSLKPNNISVNVQRLFLNSALPVSSLVRSTRWGWWWTSMGTTVVMPLSPSAPNRKPKQQWSSSTTMRSGWFWYFWSVWILEKHVPQRVPYN